ncbi:MAG: hypothetical protein WC838_05295, partial [Candidatus Margulisiibacteriota bacterium]
MKKITLVILVLAILSVAALAVPNQLTYSGRLLQNGALVNQTLPMTFYIYPVLTGGAAVWQSTADISVDVNQGIYSINLEQITPNVFSGDDRYLEVKVGSEILAPRTKINSVGYALQAGGLSNGGVQAVTVSANGYIGIGTTSPGSLVHIYNNSGDAHTKLYGNNIEFNRINNGNSTIDKIDNGNLLFRFGPASSTNVTFQNGGNVGIGTTAAGEKLEILGGMKYTDSSEIMQQSIRPYDELDSDAMAARFGGFYQSSGSNSNKVYTYNITGADPYVSTGLTFDPATYQYFALRYKTGANFSAGTNYNVGLGLGSASTVYFTIIADGKWHTAVVNVKTINGGSAITN